MSRVLSGLECCSRLERLYLGRRTCRDLSGSEDLLRHAFFVRLIRMGEHNVRLCPGWFCSTLYLTEWASRMPCNCVCNMGSAVLGACSPVSMAWTAVK